MDKHELTFDSELGIFEISCPIEKDWLPLTQKPKFCPLCGKKLDKKQSD